MIVMQKLTRLTALILTVILLFTALCGCAKQREQKVIGTCGGYEVLYEELRYLTLLYKDMLEDTYGEGIWDTPESAEKYRAELEAAVWSNILNNYAVLAAFEAYGGVPKEDMKNKAIVNAVDEEIDEAIEAYGTKKDFKAAMKEMYLTENLLRFNLTVAQLENELFYVLTQDLNLIEDDASAFMDWLEDGNCVYVQHIFIENDPGEDREANRAIAEGVRQQLLNGTDISELVGTAVNEDLQNVTPYYVVRDVYVQQKEDAAFALTEVGDVSEIVETEDGFSVMVRMQDDTATLLSKIPSLLKSYQSARMEAIIEEHKENLSVELNDYGKSIDLLEIK